MPPVSAQGPFLGHVVSASGIEGDPAKVAATAEWTRPTNMSEVCTFCGLASYYRTLVQEYAKVAKPLQDLTSCEAAFSEVKNHLTFTPILVAPRD